MREVSILTYRLSVLTLAILGTLTAGPAWACSVPVFRYALEHWRSDPYQVVYFHRGELTPEQDALLKQLARASSPGKDAANIEVFPVDLAEAQPDDPLVKDDLALWKAQNTDTLPWMVVRYPLSIRSPEPVFAGEVTQESVAQLLDSPVRKELAKRILAGDTAVWLLLESGDKEKDAKAMQSLKNELKRCEKELKLPPPDPQDVADGLISVDQASLEVRFSVVRLSRDDAQEKPFVDMLLDSEQGLRDKEFQGQPMAFPIFGRGRALYAIIGDGINREVIFDACRFLTGPCSCQVKNQNPGTDLLMAVNWEQSITPQIAVDQSLPPLPVIGTVETKEEAPKSIEADPESTSSEAVETKRPAEANQDASPPVPTDTETTAAATESISETAPPKKAASRVMMTTLICLGVAVAGIAVFSLFFVKT